MAAGSFVGRQVLRPCRLPRDERGGSGRRVPFPREEIPRNVERRGHGDPCSSLRAESWTSPGGRSCRGRGCLRGVSERERSRIEPTPHHGPSGDVWSELSRARRQLERGGARGVRRKIFLRISSRRRSGG